MTRDQHAVADEAVTNARDHRDLLDLLGELHRGDQHVRRGLGAAHDFQQFHHVGGREEVQSDDVLRPRGDGGDVVDVEVAGVRGEDRALLDDLVEAREDLLLHVHIFVDRFDHQVAVGKIAEVERRRQQAHRLFDLIGGEAALGGAGFVILADDAGAAIERVLCHFDDRHRNSGRQEVHRNAAAHRAGTEHADLLDGRVAWCLRGCRRSSMPCARQRRNIAGPWPASRSSIP